MGQLYRKVEPAQTAPPAGAKHACRDRLDVSDLQVDLSGLSLTSHGVAERAELVAHTTWATSAVSNARLPPPQL